MASKKNKQGFETRAIHSGQEPDPTTGAIMTPIYTSSTYVQESPGKHKGLNTQELKTLLGQHIERCVARNRIRGIVVLLLLQAWQQQIQYYLY